MVGAGTVIMGSKIFGSSTKASNTTIYDFSYSFQSYSELGMYG